MSDKVFDTGLYNVTKMGDPAPIPSGQDAVGRGGQFSLSASNNSVQLLTTGTFGGSDVVGLLFNLDTGASGAPVTARTMTSPDGSNSTIRLHADYVGETFALINADGLTVTYTAAAGTMAPVASGENLAVGPNLRRQVNLGYR
jgi:hypothetical protein